MKKLVLIAALLLLAACTEPGPDVDPQTQQTYLIYDYNPDEQRYELHASEITTLDDARTLDGERGFLRGGGQVVPELSEPETEQDYIDAMQIKNDREPSAEYTVREDGTIVPWDFDTQMMLTLYHHLERAAEYFSSLGFDIDRVGRLPVYYFPQISLFGVQIPIFSDNAAYAFTLDAFLIPPRLILSEDVPLSANRGVIVHEYSHAVFNRIVYQNDRVPDYLTENYPRATVESLRSLDEGVADIFAALAIGDPNFIGASISEELFDIDRDLTRKRVYDQALAAEIASANQAQPNPYILGSVVASAAWALREDLGDETLGQTVLEALDAISDPSSNFQLSDFLNAFLDAMPPSDRSTACDVFVERFPLIETQLDCPGA